jgi:hypothetical protein
LQQELLESRVSRGFCVCQLHRSGLPAQSNTASKRLLCILTK